MNNTIIGTAGHVDHGKTLLIKALTGTDTDRLHEEKKRGITIELGFAYLPLPDGSRAGIIDVPGHEKFIKNMLAGAGSVDVALLIVAADEGFMPQTREHLSILTLLGIKRGVIALTKTDLVEKDWLDMVKMDIEEEVAGTFLQNAPILPVCAVTGEGIDALKEELYTLLDQSQPRATHIPFRLPIDRVFPVEGFGTVVTGTLVEGVLNEGDSVTLYPSIAAARVRNIQVHGQDQQTAYAGQRVAVNLAGLKYTDITRGDTLAANGSMENSSLLDVALTILPGTLREIANNSRLHLHIGSSELLCRLVLMEGDALSPGQKAYAQLRLAQPLAARPGDRFVVRFYSPLETVGGGLVLDPQPQKHHREDAAVLEGFKLLEQGSPAQQISQMILRQSPSFLSSKALKRRFFKEDPAFDQAVEGLIKNQEVVPLTEELVLHQGYIDLLGQKGRTLLSAYHQANPLKGGMPRSELWGKLLPGEDTALADRVINLVLAQGFIKEKESLLADKDFKSLISKRHQQIMDDLTALFLSAGVEAPDLDEVSKPYDKEKKIYKQSFDALIDSDVLVVLTPKMAIHKSHYTDALQTFDRLEAEKGEVVLGTFRDALGTSRKYAVALLEHFDKKGLTKKTGDLRKRVR